MTVRRFAKNPIIRPEMLPGADGTNINGPSLIRVPAWVDGPLGTYYLYFADHGGRYIRLAYADDLYGPWRVHASGTLHLADVPACHGHIASPDVVVDEERRAIRMYFHGPARAAHGQKSFVAVSDNGLDFRPSDEMLGSFYFRASAGPTTTCSIRFHSARSASWSATPGATCSTWSNRPRRR